MPGQKRGYVRTEDIYKGFALTTPKTFQEEQDAMERTLRRRGCGTN